jgi:RNA recognition motif-containing protein
MNKRLFVGGLPFSATEAELREFFAPAGAVESATIIMDRFSGRSKGFGFVEMATPEEAQKAITELNGAEMGGRKLVVNEAKPQEDRPRREGGFGGGRRDGGGFRGGRRDERGGGRGGFGRKSW